MIYFSYSYHFFLLDHIVPVEGAEDAYECDEIADTGKTFLLKARDELLSP
jgi:hypothetical protein